MQLQVIDLDGTVESTTTLSPNVNLTQQNKDDIATAKTASDEDHIAVLGTELESEDLSCVTLNAFVYNGVLLKTNLVTS